MNKEKVLDVLKKIFFSFAWIPFVVLAADLASKWAVQTHLVEDQEVQIIKNFIYVTLHYNLGAAWSLGYGLRWLWITVSVVLSAGLIFYYVKNIKKLSRPYLIALTLMIGGAVGNLIDRACYWNSAVDEFGRTIGPNGVIDWILFRFGSYDFPTFNVADSCLVIGVIILITCLVIELIQDAIKKNKDGAYSMKPKDYEAKKEAEKLEENKEETDAENQSK
ncbi:MAG: signal peptidase II [Bacilli bacterium]|nr:signal peptidase II [Bacilli bacterium]